MPGYLSARAIAFGLVLASCTSPSGTAPVGAAAQGLYLGGMLALGVSQISPKQFYMPPFSVSSRGNALVMTMPLDRMFDPGSDKLRADVRLVRVAMKLQEHPNSRFEVIVHTDNVGSADENRKLSQRRAVALVQELQPYDLAASRFSAVGRGGASPIASNRTAEGQAKNRRVEIIIRPMQ
jgi:outer membrane protein OmpA-like peptidoglycan-associated protein